MANLIENELIKLFAKKKLYIFLGIIFAMILIPGLVFKFSEVAKPVSGQQFPLEILNSNVELLLPIFLAILVADLITEEYRDGTLKLFLVHPVSRSKLLHAKLITILIAVVILMAFSLVASYAMGTILFGWGQGLQFGDANYQGFQGILVTAGAHLFSILPLMACALVLLVIALNLTSGGAVVGISIGLIMGLTVLGQISLAARPYLLTTYFRYYLLFLNQPGWKELLQGVAAVLLYGGISYILSLRFFQHKDLQY
ncbi:MAG: ABC transporter permease [Halanaerobium sp.]|nr:ABC transporter permease [Halanaerobium sp.]